MRLLALLLLPMAAAAVPPVVRDTPYDWRCVDSTFAVVSNHQRQDRAIVSCQTQAEANPGETFYVEGGRYRVRSDIPAPDPDPDPVPVPTPHDLTYTTSAPAADSIHPGISPGTQVRVWLLSGENVEVSTSGSTRATTPDWSVAWAAQKPDGTWPTLQEVIEWR